MSTTTNILQDEDALADLYAKNLAKSKRPYNSPYTQQNLPTWVPIITSRDAIITFFSIGSLLAILGAILFAAAEDVHETIVTYSDICPMDVTTCTFDVTLNKDYNSQVYIYYGLTNYFQNYRKYVKSVDYAQLSGGVEQESDPCSPLGYDSTGQPYAPCGFIANSYFNDTLVAAVNNSTGEALPLYTNDIAWQSDIGTKFKNPSTFNGTARPVYWGFDIQNLPTSPAAGYVCGNERREFLFGQHRSVRCFPFIDSCYLTVTSNLDRKQAYENQDFVNWMRTMATPGFRKLWRKTNPLNAGTYTFTITNNYPVYQFGGKKKLILSTTSWMGGKNYSLGVIYMCMGGFSCILAMLFMFRNNSHPRRLGDPQYLRWSVEQRRLRQ